MADLLGFRPVAGQYSAPLHAVDPLGVLKNAFDPEGQTLTASLVATPQNGQLVFNGNGSFTFKPNQDFAGIASFIYRVSDGGLLSQTATVVLDVRNVDDPPTDILLTPSSILENSATETVVGEFSTVDPDVGDTFTYTLLDNAGGRFKLNGNQVVVANGNLLDYEAATSHLIRVESKDAAGLAINKTLTISVLDVLEEL